MLLKKCTSNAGNKIQLMVRSKDTLLNRRIHRCYLSFLYNYINTQANIICNLCQINQIVYNISNIIYPKLRFQYSRGCPILSLHISILYLTLRSQSIHPNFQPTYKVFQILSSHQSPKDFSLPREIALMIHPRLH